METLVSAVGSATARMAGSGPWGEGLTPLVRSFGASSNGGDGRQCFPRSPGFLMAGRCQLRLPGGKWRLDRESLADTIRDLPRDGWALPGRPAGRGLCVCVCALAHVCV